ncbi:MAG: hypothetical protein HOE48_09905, partial [Candidatus Latescibacteria bacterium]|nr:hypothetical protein [Candidatus Latescibacterota bacterium]
MIPPNGETNETLYEQVLDFARKEIEDASSQMEELRRALHVVEARVEAAKSVYESVAARLNLEDEMEDEARLDVTQLSNLPPMPSQSAAPPASDEPAPTQTPAQATPKPIVPPVAKEPEPPLFAPESAPPAFVAPPVAP